MYPFGGGPSAPPALEDIRKRAQLLVIDDHSVPFVQLFKRDGYHIQRWPTIKNLSDLTEGRFDVVLLDLHGVAIKESPDEQGLGILKHIKETDPTQLVIAYSGQTWSAPLSEFVVMADAVLAKNASYVEYKGTVDRLLQRRYSEGYFIAIINGILGDSAAQAPKLVPKTLRAFRSGKTVHVAKYARAKIQDEVTVDRSTRNYRDRCEFATEMTAQRRQGLFPYPTVCEDERYNGSLLDWPPPCVECPTRECESATVDNIVHTCSYGINYNRPTKATLVAGFVLIDSPTATTAQRSKRKSLRSHGITKANAERSLQAIRRRQDAQDDLAEARRAERLTEYMDNSESRKALADELRPQIVQSLNQAHDYLLMLQQIQSNAETILQTRYPGIALQEAAERLPNEGAIYFAAQLMTAKIDATKYLTEPNLINGPAGEFAIYKFVDKYFRIYQAWAKQREVIIDMSGTCFALVRYPHDAIGAVIHTVLDNMVKYAPPGSRATVGFIERSSEVLIAYTSLGPKIQDHEKKKIFIASYQAEAARQRGPGMGFGLSAAKIISDTLDLRLSVTQARDEDAQFPGNFETTFSLRLEKVGVEDAPGKEPSTARRGRRHQ